MHSIRAFRHGLKRASWSSKELRRGIVTDADVDQARNYCLNQLQSVLCLTPELAVITC